METQYISKQQITKTTTMEDIKKISGKKCREVYGLMLHLEKMMIYNGATHDEVMIFEADFLKDNGIYVPDSFWTQNKLKTIDDFVDTQLIESSKHMKALKAYTLYCQYCDDKNIISVSKYTFYNYLRQKKIMANSGTINGKTIRNVLLRKEPKNA